MNGYEIAWIIVAVAIAVLVFYIIQLLKEARPILKALKGTVDQVNHATGVVVSDVDALLNQAENLIAKVNQTVYDVNGKLTKMDPLFTSLGEVGTTVSDVNQLAQTSQKQIKKIPVQLTRALKEKKSSTNFSKNKVKEDINLYLRRLRHKRESVKAVKISTK